MSIPIQVHAILVCVFECVPKYLVLMLAWVGEPDSKYIANTAFIEDEMLTILRWEGVFM